MESTKEVNWVNNLPLYQKLYNESPHRSLGLAAPFQVYFGRKLNSLKNRLTLNGDSSKYEVEEEAIDDELLDFHNDLTASEVNKWRTIQAAIRTKAEQALKKGSLKHDTTKP